MDRYETILWEQEDRVVTITMNRPEVRNAQNQQMLDELDRAFKRAAGDDSVGVIILAGAGKDFSSGHDVSPEKVKADSERPWEERYETCRRYYLESLLAWRDLPKPTIARVQGNCIMGGMMLALSCDLVVCADDARFISRSVRWGASSEQYLMLPWLVGVPAAKRMLFTGDPVDSQTALRMGLVTEVVPRADLEAVTGELARRISLQDPFALRMSKRACNAMWDLQGQKEHLERAFELWALTALRPATLEQMASESSLPVTERIRRRDERFDE